MNHCREAFGGLICSLIAILVCTHGLAASAQEAAAYFPLMPGRKYTYSGTHRENVYRETIVSREFIKDGVRMIYFIREADVDKGFSIIGSNMIGLGVYSGGAEGIYTHESYYLGDLGKVSGRKSHLLFRGTLKEGDSLRIASDDTGMTLVVTVMEFSAVSVPAGTFKDCIKVHIKEVWPNKTYDGYTWFARGAGMVKWVRSTGRVDVLVSYGTADTQPVA